MSPSSTLRLWSNRSNSSKNHPLVKLLLWLNGPEQWLVRAGEPRIKMRQSILERVAGKAGMISFSYLVQELTDGITLVCREPGCLVGEHYKVPEAENWSRDCLPLPDELRNCGRIVCRNRKV